MLRIQLVIEDYAELSSLQIMLKKLGFDVDATQNQIGLGDQLLTLNPDLVIMTGFGRKVAGYELARQLRKVRGLPHVVLLHEPGQPAVVDPAVAAWLTAPAPRETLIGLIAKFAQMNEALLLEKYHRHARETGALPEVAPVAGGLQPSTMAVEDRRARYREFLKVTPPPTHGFAAGQVRDQVKALRKAESDEDQADLERERRAFVAQLFKKGS